MRRTLLLGLMGLWPLLGQAGEALYPMPADPRYVDECGSCHTAYAPALLPSADWRQVFAELERHYGSDASIDPRLGNPLLEQVVALAGPASQSGGDPPRITRSRLFHYQHDEMPAYVWARITSRAQCGACHTRADQGRYLEREVRIPTQ